MLVLSTLREIKQTLGRYLALMMIIALGVGFFAGLKVTDPAMRQSMYTYLTDKNFYDFRLISSLGFEDEDINYLQTNIDEKVVESSISFDIITNIDETTYVMKAISIPEKINQIEITAGKEPQNDEECLVDVKLFDESAIGSKVVISDTNTNEDAEHFRYKEYTITGLVKSPLYIQYERGTTNLGTGVLDGFIYINQDGFDVDYYTDCYVKLDYSPELYSDEYDEVIKSKKDNIQNQLDKVADDRYKRIIDDANEELNDAIKELEDTKAEKGQELEDAKSELDDAKKQLDTAKKSIAEYEDMESQLKSGLDEMLNNINQMEAAMAMNPSAVDQNQYQVLVAAYQENSAKLYSLQTNLKSAKEKYRSGMNDYESGLKEYEDGLKEFNDKIADAELEIEDAKDEIADIEEATTYLLDRDSNPGYVCFESDSTIVGAIANVFPVFFFLVAALVCMTTMGRMVEDQRTQIGVLKALGYSNLSIMGKFVAYSGSAAMIGAALGFIVGTWVFPQAIWYAYQMMYNTSTIDYYFSPAMLIISFVVAFICSVGVTVATCRYEMGEMAASLMRPKAPKAGKRIFLEYVPFFWNRLKFLKKVSLRNIFRYKGRLIMMVLGIGGCTALLVAGFGIYDSIADIANNQYSNISLYDMDITLKDGADGDVPVVEKYGYDTDDYLLYYHTSVDMKAGKHTKNIYLNVYEDDAKISNFIDMHDKNWNPVLVNELKDNQVIINHGLCDRYGIKLGDKITLSSEDISPTTFVVAGINQNFINNYVYMTKSVFENNVGPLPEKKNLYLNILDDEDAHAVGAKLMDERAITVVTSSVDMLERVENMMKSLNIIIYLVIGCAMALAAVVVYNLTNINIAERVREIATVKVLGFYKEETRSYVFRENILLAIMGGLVGLGLGKLLHAFVMSEIVVDLITFDVRVTALSYFLSFILTIIFTFLINLLMGKKLDEISMTESLKAVE